MTRAGGLTGSPVVLIRQCMSNLFYACLFAATIYERSPELASEALAPYETAAELAIKARGLLESIAEGAQVARITTLCLKVEGWVRYRTFETMNSTHTRQASRLNFTKSKPNLLLNVQKI